MSAPDVEDPNHDEASAGRTFLTALGLTALILIPLILIVPSMAPGYGGGNHPLWPIPPLLAGGALAYGMAKTRRRSHWISAWVPLTGGLALTAFLGFMLFETSGHRHRRSEPRAEMAKMFDAVSAFFQEEHVDRGATELVNDTTAPGPAPHRCPSDGRVEGRVGPTPPLSVDCAEHPDGHCVPSENPEGPGEYHVDVWRNDPVWNELNFQVEQNHRFHYAYRWLNGTEGFGNCQFTIMAYGDLDGDGIYSTFERSGAGDVNGVNAAAGLYIDREVE